MATIIASKGESHNSEADESICVEVNRWASRATLDIIGQGGFGQSFNAIQDPDNAISRTYRSLFRPDWRGQILGVLGFLLPVRVVELLPSVMGVSFHANLQMIHVLTHGVVFFAMTK